MLDVECWLVLDAAIGLRTSAGYLCAHIGSGIACMENNHDISQSLIDAAARQSTCCLPMSICETAMLYFRPSRAAVCIKWKEQKSA